MRELGPDRLSDDGRFLVLRDPGSAEVFRVPVDRRLTSLVSASPRARGRAEGQMEITMESTLSPRDIQTRIRRGESPDQVAESAGVPTEQIEGFATPVLAERAFMAEQARGTAVRRRHTTGPGQLLGVAVDETVASDGHVPEDAVWDAWRREDGRWTVQVVTPGADDAATFCFDSKGRFVLPDDELARLLVGDVELPEVADPDMAIADALRGTPAEAPAATAPAEPAAPPVETVADFLADGAQDDEPHAPVHSLKEARDRRAMEQLSLAEAADQTDDEPQHPSAKDADSERAEDADVRPEEDEGDVAVPDTMGPRKKRPERRRVPSWDEIMFGGSQD